MNGCVATFVEVDKIDEYIWSPMPQLSFQLERKLGFGLNNEVIGSIRLCGGFAYREEIKVFGAITIAKPKCHNIQGKRIYESDETTKCWGTAHL